MEREILLVLSFRVLGPASLYEQASLLFARAVPSAPSEAQSFLCLLCHLATYQASGASVGALAAAASNLTMAYLKMRMTETAEPEVAEAEQKLAKYYRASIKK